jgi:hypothetical protein
VSTIFNQYEWSSFGSLAGDHASAGIALAEISPDCSEAEILSAGDNHQVVHWRSYAAQADGDRYSTKKTMVAALGGM